MKILTLNTWQERGPWRERWNIILKGLSHLRPDVVFFQEVFNPCWAEKVRAHAGYRYLVFPCQPSGLVMLSRYPVRAQDFITYKMKSPTEEYSRYASFVKLKIQGREIGFFNTHLSWRIPEVKVRRLQVRELLAYMETKAKHLPIFAAGDFNAHAGSMELEPMVREGRFIDVYALRNPGRNGLTWNNKNPFTAGSSVRMPDRRIDFLWMRDPKKIFKVRSAELVFEKPRGGIYASDHFGVLAEVTRVQNPEEES